jgi:hypothetical protein
MATAKLTVTTKPRAQIRAEFRQVFKDLQAAKPKPAVVTQEQRLAPYKEEILKLRRAGVTWRQIADRMAPPPIAEVVSETVLRRVFGAADAAQAAKANPPLPRLALDPVTGNPIAVDPVTGQRVELDAATGQYVPVANTPAAPVAPPAPMTPKEHEQFDPLFQSLIPPIVSVKSNRRDAHAYANNAVELMRPKEIERFHALLTAELDNLTESNCAKYNIPPEQIAPWKRRWA